MEINFGSLGANDGNHFQGFGQNDFAFHSLINSPTQGEWHNLFKINILDRVSHNGFQ